MKILQVISPFPPAYSYGGAPNVAYELSKQLVKMGHSITVYTTDAKDATSRLKYNNPMWMDGIEVYHFKNLSNKLSYKNFPLAPAMALKLRKELHKFDLVHLHEYRSFQAIFVHYYCKKYKIPYILQAHGSVKRITERYTLKLLFDYIWGSVILKDTKCFIAVSKNEIKQYNEMGINKENIFLVPNALNIENFKNLPKKGILRSEMGINSNSNIILYLGRIHKRKGLNFLIRTFANLVKVIDNVVLVIIGPDENYRKYLEKIVIDLNLSDVILFRDYMENVSEAYVDADLLVYPAIHEIFGLVPFEAILCDTPVIVTNDCGCGEFITEASCGYLVEFGNTDDLESKIKNSLHNPKKGEYMVNRGKEYIFNNLVWEKIAEKVERVYENCIYNL